MNRSLSCLKKNYVSDAEKCYERAMELTDLTVEDIRWGKGLKDLLRFREVLSELYLSKNADLNRDCLTVLLSFDAGAWNMLAVR